MRRALCLCFILICLVIFSGVRARPATIPEPPKASAQEEYTPPLPVAPLGAHPRLLISPAYIRQVLQPRASRKYALWQPFRDYLDSARLQSDLRLQPAETIRALALGWLLTEQRAYRDNALAGMRALVDQIESAPVMQTLEGKWDNSFLEAVAGLALGYDWMYAALSPDDRIIVADTLLRACDRLRDPTTDSGRVWIPAETVGGDAGTYIFRAMSDEDALWLWAITATALAVQGEDIRANTLIEYARDLWVRYVLPVLEIQPNGAWGEGLYYGFTAIWWKVQTALSWWTARGENYFDATAWWQERLAYNLFARYPQIWQTRTDAIAFWDYPAIIGDNIRRHPRAVYGRAQDLILRAVFPGTPYANWTDWSLNQLSVSAPGWLLAEELLWRDADAMGEPPAQLTWRAFGSNHVFMHSRWVDETGEPVIGETVVTFQAGDFFSPRQFFDQGSFTIWRAGDSLVGRGGIYSGDGTSWHDANYYGRTVAGNTLLICDLAENFDGIRLYNDTPAGIWLNDCGQRPTDPLGGINADYWANNRARFETANILRVRDETSLTYILANLTGAYNSATYTALDNRPKVTFALREIFFIRPELILIHDRVRTPDPQFTVLQTLHFNTAPEFDGIGWTVRGANAKLYLQQLAPSQSEITEGYLVEGQAVERSDGQPVQNEIEFDRPGVYQMNTFSTGASQERWFLTLLAATDINAAPPATALFVQGEGIRGAVFNNEDTLWQVMMDDDPQDLTQARFAIAGGTQFLFLTGLAPAQTYTLIWADGSQTRALSDGAGTLLFSDPPAGVLDLRL